MLVPYGEFHLSSDNFYLDSSLVQRLTRVHFFNIVTYVGLCDKQLWILGLMIRLIERLYYNYSWL
jgi:hypothetical protein